ncbi:RING-type E3 ubiquitin transferase [Purpureocillium takamizusanense]|uniref:RING-type E3 ubiquitin transferase n=1 Tax=Purpureocillium takamizusanense TaxID=2060973 RepID=A0A9Q8QE73_9HYPO|nr:RING-type E3 ubiquitin transferase [Purpureocillium takamizusanense]UNI17324.1 RING-type E3 ubiquitin transferase [Purpureocillium takamizusanense]
MKFAHDFKQTLASQGFPAHWVNQAIPYSQLKKCLKKVQRELQDLGLDPDTLRTLLDPNTVSPVALEYRLKVATDSNVVRPKLTVYVHMQDGVAVDASLTPTSRRFFERIAAELPLDRSQQQHRLEQEVAVRNGEGQPQIKASAKPATVEPSNSPTSYETIEVPLVFDSEFFDILQSDVSNLEALQTEERRKMTAEIVALSAEVAQVSQPNRFSKTDMARWRRIFELYLDAEVFFATHERDHGSRPSQSALRQLQWFQGEVDKRHLATDFKLRESRAAFSRFLSLNVSLLKNLQFQELNRLAVFKILKKFDKRTSLGVSQTFPNAIQAEGVLASDIAKDVCAQMSLELVSVVPQLNDFLCPVCFSVAYRPVRLDCQHVFCIRCIVKIQRRQERHCPLCRADVVMNASADNLDHKLEKYMKKYFSKEVKEKQRANEIERGIEDYGPGYTHQECMIM